MTDEERQRQMDFIVNQQAEFSVKLDRLGEKVDALTGNVGALADAQRRSDEKWARTEEGIRSLLSIAEIHEREITGLKETARATTEAGRATDERLNALVNMFERYLSERRNGKEQGNQ